MNIGDMNLHINNPSTEFQGGSLSAPISNTQGENTQVFSGNAAITQIMEGQTFQGKVVNITGNDVQIMLHGDKMLSARMAEAVNINIGDSLSFLVQENNGNTIQIRPVPVQDNSYNFQTIQKALDANHFLPTQKNYQIAQSLMDYGMPLDKSTMQQIMQQSVKFGDLPIDTLVHMNKMGLQVNEASISQFQSYMEGTHQLSDAIADLSNSITEFSVSVVNEMTTDTLASAQDLISFQNTLLETVVHDDTGYVEMAKLNDVPGKELNFVNNEAALVQQLRNVVENALQIAKAEGQNAKELANAFTEQLSDVISSLKRETTEYDANSLFVQVNKALSEAVTMENLDLSKDVLATLLNSKGFTTLLSDTIKQKFTLNKETLKDAGEIDVLYKKMYDASNRLQQSFENIGGKAGEEMREQAGNMKQRLDFIQNLNELYAYAQLPVRLQEEAFHSELYVYMNKKQKQAAKDAVSALLHLDMDHLGPTDVHVSLHGTTVHTKFYVEDPVSAAILDDHMNQLEQEIAKMGFTLTNEVVMREPSIMGNSNSVIHEMMNQDMEKSIKRYTFDVRM